MGCLQSRLEITSTFCDFQSYYEWCLNARPTGCQGILLASGEDYMLQPDDACFSCGLKNVCWMHTECDADGKINSIQLERFDSNTLEQFMFFHNPKCTLSTKSLYPNQNMHANFRIDLVCDKCVGIIENSMHYINWERKFRTNKQYMANVQATVGIELIPDLTNIVLQYLFLLNATSNTSLRVA